MRMDAEYEESEDEGSNEDSYYEWFEEQHQQQDNNGTGDDNTRCKNEEYEIQQQQPLLMRNRRQQQQPPNKKKKSRHHGIVTTALPIFNGSHDNNRSTTTSATALIEVPYTTTNTTKKYKICNKIQRNSLLLRRFIGLPRRISKSRIIFILLCILLLFLLWTTITKQRIVLDRTNNYNNNNINNTNTDFVATTNDDDDDIPDCTFEDLQASFGSPWHEQQIINRCSSSSSSNSSKVLTTTDDDMRCCWTLRDLILRIPVSSIRVDKLQKLGNGRKGSVYKAVIVLSKSSHHHHHHHQEEHQQRGRQCTVAIKTDHCTTNSIWQVLRKTIVLYVTDSYDDYYASSSKNIDSITSCIVPNSYVADTTSFLASEYTGALIYYAQRLLSWQSQQHEPKNQFPLPGLLPTYAVIVTDNNNSQPLHSIFHIPRRFWKGSPIRRGSITSSDHQNKQLYDSFYGTILGVVLPIQQFEPITQTNLFHTISSNNNLDNNNNGTASDNTPPPSNAATIAHTFLSAAEGLEFVNVHMRLAFQDIKEKNIGIRSTEDAMNGGVTSSLVYDHTYIGMADPNSPALAGTQCNSIACRYCVESIFPPASRKADLYVDPIIKSTVKKTKKAVDSSYYKYDNLQSDYYHFRLVLMDILEKNCSGIECLEMRSKLQESVTITRLVNILREYI